VASRIAGVKLHHSLSHVLCHPEFSLSQYRSGHLAGHPKLLQLETPSLSIARFVSDSWAFLSYKLIAVTDFVWSHL